MARSSGWGLLLNRASHVLHAALSTCFAKKRVDAPTAAEVNLRVLGSSTDDRLRVCERKRHRSGRGRERELIKRPWT